jgi:formate dehydrogenase gamma subunit
MNKARFLSIGVLIALGAGFLVLGPERISAAAGGGSDPASNDEENLGRYVGRALVSEGRAGRAEVEAMLPMSCPPFYLRDEYGQIIDPNTDPSVSRPVSTKQTCGACHDYARVTRGYHFQTGKDELRESPKLGQPVPLDKGPGFYGKWLPLYQRELAPKTFAEPGSVDMTSFEWASDCAICHPGGGPAEYDRGWKRYDEVMGGDAGMALALDGDYYGARWNETGVIEADCLICHLETYDYSTRAQQIKKLNFKWAGAAAAGFGAVEGSVKDNQVPKLTYRKELFGPDGKVHLKIRRPSDRACQFCHDMSGVQKRGTGWHTHYMQDVHTERGLCCIDCHPGDIRHNFAKGRSSVQTVRDDLDGGALSCKECHETRRFNAPDYSHPGLPPVHFNRLSCEACHITRRPFLSARTVDTLTGKAIELPEQVDPTAGGDRVFGAWWGKVAALDQESIFVAFPRDQINGAAAFTIGADDAIRRMLRKADGTPALPAGPVTVKAFVEQQGGMASEEARALMLAVLARTVPLAKPFQAACVFRGTAYVMSGDRLVELDTRLQAKRVGAISEYPVTYGLSKQDGLIYPEGCQLGAFWAWREGGLAKPLFLNDMKAAWEFLKQARPTLVRDGNETPLAVWDDNNDRWPEANTDEEIGLVAWALNRTAARLKGQPLFYIKGENAHRVIVEDSRPIDAPPEGKPFLKLREGKDKERFETPFTARVARCEDPAVQPLARRLSWSITHGVEPATEALGAKGCGDCHSENGHFFYGGVTVDPFGSDGRPVTIPMYKVIGYEPVAYPGSFDGLRLGAWREQVLKPLSPWIVLGVLGLMLLHFVLFGMHQRTGGYAAPDVARFRAHERIVHAVAMVSVGFLAVTGFSLLLGKSDPLGAWARALHTQVGFAGAAGTLLVFLVWFFLMFPARGDFKWLIHAGGYLGGQGHYPAGKFNAGQKILFWLAVFLMAVLAATGIRIWQVAGARDPWSPVLYTIHDAAALLMILVLMVHVYLAVVLNPHSLRSLFGGKVSMAWAQENHPNWKALRK